MSPMEVMPVKGAGVDPAQISYLLLTHGHGDHAAGASYFQEKYGMELIAAQEMKEWLENGDLEKFSVPQAINAGVYPSNYQYMSCSVTRGVKENDQIEIGNLILEVLETPGHSRGHISFLLRQNERKLLFAGDSIFAGGKVVIQNIWDCIIPEYALTAAKLHRLRVDSLFAGHGTFVINEAWKHIETAHTCFEKLNVPPNL